ncbi:Centromere protein 3 [Leucoagaricus sp. SymC.cos]|nr:Centromere protein 3 [Leucoagaricus sp. SymC.cos]
MPSSARKSSIGTARRNIQKAHIPYRGDNPEVGKKTGIAVGHVDRMSDGFEPFEEVMQQADKRTPPRPKRKKKSVPAVQQPAFDEEDGEMSMDIDDSPVRYLSNARIPSTPTLRNTSGNRPVARSSAVDFDDIPSPRPRSSVSRVAKAGPSSLSKNVTVRDVEPDSDSDNELADYGDYNNDMDINGMNGDYDPQDSPPPTSPPQVSSPRRKSFAQIAEDLDGQEEDEEQEQDLGEDDIAPELPRESPPRTDPRKRKDRLEDIQEEDELIEEEIAQGLNALEDDISEEEEQARIPPPKKKQRFVHDDEKLRRSKSSKSKKENREYREGTRRSKRERFKPLEWWRGEKVVYGRTNTSGPILVPNIKEIRRIPVDKPEPLGQRRRGYNRARSKTADDKLAPAVYNPEDGWDDATDPFGEVYDLDKQALVVRRLAWTQKRVSLTKAAKSDWSFEKVFGDSDFVAAGQLLIPPDCRKPTKATKDNTYIFYVIEGAVNFKVHEISKVVATGGMFIAPRGNTYFIENISKRDAKLFFTQARKVPKEDMEPFGSAPPPRREKKKSLEEVRSSSPGQSSAAASGRAAQSLPPQTSQVQQKTKAGKRAPSAKV